MRTNIDIDDEPMRAAMRTAGLGTKRETVELGLQTLTRLGRQQELRRLRGKLAWEGDLDSIRTNA